MPCLGSFNVKWLDALAASELSVKRKARGFKRVMEHSQSLILECGSQVEQDVAATNQVQVRNGRILGQIVPREDTQLSQVFVDPITAVGLGEKAFQTRCGHAGDGSLRVDAGARMLDGELPNIGPKYLDRLLYPPAVPAPRQGAWRSNRLLLRWNIPATQIRSGCLRRLRRKFARIHFRKASKTFRIAEETRKRNKDLIGQGFRILRGCAAGAWAYCARSRNFLQSHLPENAANDRGLLVVAEVDPGGSPKDLENIIEILGCVPSLLGPVRVAAEASQFERNARR